MTLEQQLKLLDYRSSSTPTQKDPSTIWIDGNKITGYFEYFYVNAKSYAVGDNNIARSLDGKIPNLNSYPTFLTPRLKLNFKYMDIKTYRTIMKLIQSKNEFTVTCYDIVEDKMVTHKMYFQPEDYPDLFHRGLEILAVTDYEIELTGTNNDLGKISIIYHSNPPEGMGSDTTTGSSDTYAFGEEVIIGQGVSYSFNGYTLENWNTAADGSGFTYLNNEAYTINVSNDLILYAQWTDTDIYTLSYNYGYGAAYVDSSGKTVYNKSITIGNTYGTLPDTDPPTVTYDEEENIQPYTKKGWYQTPVIVANSTAITANTVYNIAANTTIYQIFEPKEYTITYEMNGANETFSPLTQRYNETIYAPQTPTKNGFVFDGWYKDTKFEKAFNFTVMPPKSITIYAKWVKEQQ